MKILSIDPGNVQSAWVIWDTHYQQIVKKFIVPNEQLLNWIWIENEINKQAYDYAFIEMVACYGMAVGKTVFDTARWAGRFQEALVRNSSEKKVQLVYRMDIKMFLCHSTRAKDGNVRQAIIDRLGEPGTKSKPGATYGCSKDIWAALAVALYAEHLLKGEKQ